MSVTIDGTDLKDLGIRVLLDLDYPATPKTRDKTVTIPDKHGEYDFGAYFGALPHELECRVFRQGNRAIQQASRELKELLLDEEGRPKTVELRYTFEPEKYYNVRLRGNIPLQRLVLMGEFTLPLTAHDPFAYAPYNAYDEPPGEYADVLAQYQFTGKTIVNYVPLFDSGLWNFHSNVTVDSPTKITLNADGDHQASYLDIDIVSQQTYTLNASYSSGAEFYLSELDTSGTEINGGYVTLPHTFTALADTDYITLWLTNRENGAGLYTFESITLNEGNVAKEFVSNVGGVANPTLINHTNDESQMVKDVFYENEQLTFDQTATKSKVWETEYPSISNGESILSKDTTGNMYVVSDKGEIWLDYTVNGNTITWNSQPTNPKVVYELAETENESVAVEGYIHLYNGDYTIEFDQEGVSLEEVQLISPVQQTLIQGSNTVSVNGLPNFEQYDSGLMYENVESFEWRYPIHYTGSYNYSYYATPLKMEIQGSVINPRVTDLRTGRTMKLPTIQNQTLVIDGESQTITRDGENVYSESENLDFSLLGGDIQLKFEGGHPKATVKMTWTHKFM